MKTPSTSSTAKVVLTITCENCGEEQPAIHMTHQQLLRWRQGELIQRILPDASSSVRELLISGMCGRCFDMFFLHVD